MSLMRESMRKPFRAAVFLCGWIFFSFTFGLVNFVLSAAVDFSIAERSGGVSEISQDVAVFGGGQSFGGIEWTFSSILGPLLALPIPFGAIFGMLLTGLFVWLILWNIITGRNKRLGNYNWLVFANVAVWLLRFPVPIEYSLFYWTAIMF